MGIASVRMRMVAGGLLFAWAFMQVSAVDVGRRAGGRMVSTGGFSMSGGGNRAGNDEALAFLGEDDSLSTADELEASAEQLMELAGERKNKANRKRAEEEAKQHTASTSEVAELGAAGTTRWSDKASSAGLAPALNGACKDDARCSAAIKGECSNAKNSRRRDNGERAAKHCKKSCNLCGVLLTKELPFKPSGKPIDPLAPPVGYKLFKKGGFGKDFGSAATGKCYVNTKFAVHVCNTKDTKKGSITYGKMCGCHGTTVISKLDMSVDFWAGMTLAHQKWCRNMLVARQVSVMTQAATNYQAAGFAKNSEGCGLVKPKLPDLAPCSGCYPGTKGTCKASNKVCYKANKGRCPASTSPCLAKAEGSNGKKASSKKFTDAIKKDIAGGKPKKKKPTGPCKHWCRGKSMCTNHRKRSCKGCSFCG